MEWLERVRGVRGERRNSRQSKGLVVSKGDEGGVLGRMKLAPEPHSSCFPHLCSFSQHLCAHIIKLFSLLEMIFSQLPDELLLILQKPYPRCRLPWAFPGTALLQVDSITVLPSPAPFSSTSGIGEESPLDLISVEVCLEVYTKNRCLWGGHIIKERDLKTQ